MANNRDDKYEGSDDEYHFSDDEEVSYEVENETTQQAAPPRGKGGVASRLGSRRVIISFVVFLAIVFVVYKFISPSATTPPPAELTAAPAPQTTVVQTAPAPKPNVVIQQAPAPARMVVPEQSAPQNQSVAALPAVIPVQSDEPSQGQSPAAAMGTYIDEKSKSMNEVSQQAMSVMEAQYSQKLNQFNEQNKVLQNQVQSLSSRVADMEAQINQLVQVLTRRNHAAAPSTSSAQSITVEQTTRSPDVKVAYNVQAIIPGRAWLKAENGETVTVAEGDVIRNVGRVTKIDPYDGVVEINTGSKAISLSYGNGG